MSEQAVRKTYQYKLKPTPQQEWELGLVLGLCHSLYNTALEQRISAWQRARVSVSRFQQEAELKDIRAAMPEYAAIHSHVLQDVLARLDKTYQAFIRRLKAGEKAGFPRYQGHDRYHSFTYKEFGNGATLDNGFLVLSKIGRITVRWSRPVEGTIGNNQDRHHFAGSRRLVWVFLVRRCVGTAFADHWTGNRHRPWARGCRHAVKRHAHLQPWLVSEGRTGAENGATACQSPQEREQPQA